MTRHKYHILLFFFSIPFNFMVFKNWWTDVQSNWSGAFPFLVLFATLGEIYFSKRNFVRAGMVAMGVFVLGILLRIPHWPGSTLCVFLGLGSLTFIPMWNAIQAREQKTLRLIIATWILLHGAGAVLKVLHWPAGGLLIISSMIFLTVVTIALGLTLWQAKQKQNDRNI